MLACLSGAGAEKAAPDLTRALRDENPEVRRVAASTLGNLGVVTKRSAPGLIVLLEDPMTDVRRAALKALGQVEDDAAVVRSNDERQTYETDQTIDHRSGGSREHRQPHAGGGCQG